MGCRKPENEAVPVPRFPDSYHTAHEVSSGGTGNEKNHGQRIHLPNSIEEVDRVHIPLTDTPTQWNEETRSLLANVLHWQGEYVAEWIMRRAIDYHAAKGYPQDSCYFQAALDWELWRRRAYIPELDYRNPSPSRERAAEQYFYQMATLEKPNEKSLPSPLSEIPE
jgi:hypothetical protein